MHKTSYLPQPCHGRLRHPSGEKEGKNACPLAGRPRFSFILRSFEDSQLRLLDVSIRTAVAANKAYLPDIWIADFQEVTVAAFQFSSGERGV